MHLVTVGQMSFDMKLNLLCCTSEIVIRVLFHDMVCFRSSKR